MKKSVILGTIIDQVIKQHGIVIGDYRKHVNHIKEDVECVHTPNSIHDLIKDWII